MVQVCVAKDSLSQGGLVGERVGLEALEGGEGDEGEGGELGLEEGLAGGGEVAVGDGLDEEVCVGLGHDGEAVDGPHHQAVQVQTGNQELGKCKDGVLIKEECRLGRAAHAPLDEVK